MKNVKNIFLSTALILFSLFVFPKRFFTITACNPPANCGDNTIETNNDLKNDKVHINFESDNHRSHDYKTTISVNGRSGWQVTGVWLDVEDDNHSGYFKYSTSSLSDFNPSPGKKINKVKVSLYKDCPSSPTPTVEITPTITPEITPEVTPATEVTPSPTPVPTIVENTQSTNDSPSQEHGAPVCSDQKPGTPSDLKAGYIGNGQISLSWTHASAPHTSYLVAFGPCQVPFLLDHFAKLNLA